MSSPQQTNAAPQYAPSTSVSAGGTNDLRTMVLGLGLGMIVLCVAFGAFIIRQNMLVTLAHKARVQQADQLKGQLQKPEVLKQWEMALNELAEYSKGNPELTAIFNKYRVDISSTGSTVEKPQPKAP